MGLPAQQRTSVDPGDTPTRGDRLNQALIGDIVRPWLNPETLHSAVEQCLTESRMDRASAVDAVRDGTLAT